MQKPSFMMAFACGKFFINGVRDDGRVHIVRDGHVRNNVARGGIHTCRNNNW